jgi:hypothetical protein
MLTQEDKLVIFTWNLFRDAVLISEDLISEEDWPNQVTSIGLAEMSEDLLDWIDTQFFAPAIDKTTDDSFHQLFMSARHECGAISGNFAKLLQSQARELAGQDIPVVVSKHVLYYLWLSDVIDRVDTIARSFDGGLYRDEYIKHFSLFSTLKAEITDSALSQKDMIGHNFWNIFEKAASNLADQWHDRVHEVAHSYVEQE